MPQSQVVLVIARAASIELPAIERARLILKGDNLGEAMAMAKKETFDENQGRRQISDQGRWSACLSPITWLDRKHGEADFYVT